MFIYIYIICIYDFLYEWLDIRFIELVGVHWGPIFRTEGLISGAVWTWSTSLVKAAKVTFEARSRALPTASIHGERHR